MNVESFKWEESTSSPIGYPIEVYKGGFESRDGGYTSLDNGTDTGPWGLAGNGKNGGEKPVPNKLNVVWLSYAEDTFYHIDCDIDDKKMIGLFNEGFNVKSPLGKIKHDTYKKIVAGFAPGGVVVIWLFGASKQVEIGRYQGKKIVINQQEIKSLDYPKKLLFEQSYRNETMQDENIIPTAIYQANKNKPIPYGLWDTYRQKYLWRPTFNYVNSELSDTTKVILYTRLEMFNGEVEGQFDESLDKNVYSNRAILKKINFAWKDVNEQVYSGTIDLDEQEIFNAFKEISKTNNEGEIDVQFYINRLNDFVTVQIKQGDKEIRLIKSKVNVFKSSKKFN